MRDDIMRLAERVAEMDIVCNMTHLAARDLCEMRDAIAAELRALARTDHSEDKLGMVPAEANEWAFEDKKRMRGDYAAAAGWNACRDAMLAAVPAPNHSAGVGGVVADDEMVERAAKAVADDWQSGRLKKIPWDQLVHAQKELARAQARIVIAALAQPADADGEGGE